MSQPQVTQDELLMIGLMMPWNIQAIEIATFWPEVFQGQVFQKHAVLLKGHAWKGISTRGL